MKQSVNFRLSNKANTTLLLLAKKLEISKTAIIEEAIACFAKKAIHKENVLLKHAGVLNEQDADEILHAIKTSRKSKKTQVAF